MTALASTNVTVTCNREDMILAARKKIGLATIAFGNGALTYPSGGVPMPAIGKFGMVRDLRMKVFETTDGVVWQYDATNNKMRGYLPGVTVSAAGSATLDDYAVNTTSDGLASAGMVLGLANTAGASTYYLGKLKEIATGAAVPAVTLTVEVSGW